ncbi:hypothetical protein NKR23_g5609 [Pleurostoma richardsiae]|uniref:Uncharacterized protein n=1 Tax=Pleurostoma richardsiae TaxID=41990 RepID=A0AA38RGF1_9PEZI|nr:hypothetical protein NKR23_g5609 [Pleurostoma richardsiae]
MDHWERQIKLHCDELSYQAYRRSGRLAREVLSAVDVVGASYHDLARPRSMKLGIPDSGYDISDFNFHRIILDECHEIKNPKSQTAQAMFSLKAKYKWCCSATPIPNGSQEMYSYMKFLGVEHSETLTDWNVFYRQRAKNGTNNLEKLLRKLMLRRTEQATFFNQPVIDVPAKNILPPVEVEFSEEEEIIYNVIKRHYRSAINEQLEANPALAKRQTVFAKVHRLRQATAHIYLAENVLRDDFDLNQIRDMLEKLHDPASRFAFLRQFRDVCQVIETSKAEAGPTAVQVNIDPQLRMLEKIKEKIEKNCPACGKEPLAEIMKTECGHIWHQACLDRKTVLDWQEAAPNDKIIIFTQWYTLARIVGRVLEDEGIGFAYLYGEMDLGQRLRTVETFKSVDTVKVLVASLKCGGQSLDLTCASRVILVDLWWNLDVENQAFARVYRLGQKKETHFARIIVKNSVDEKLMEIQKSKGKEIDQMLKEFDPTAPKMTSLELANIFGRVKELANGNFRILSDDEDESDEDQSSAEDDEDMHDTSTSCIDAKQG